MKMRQQLTVSVFLIFLILNTVQTGFLAYHFSQGHTNSLEKESFQVNTLNLIISIVLLLFQMLGCYLQFATKFEMQQISKYHTVQNYFEDKVKLTASQ